MTRIKHNSGTAIKAITPNKVGGYLVVWGNSDIKDLHGEYFTPETNFELEWYEQRPALYNHGLDGTLKTAVVGRITSIKADETGLWAEAQLDMHKQYVDAVRQLIDAGVLHWSSGSLSHLVDIDKEDGRIKRWPIVEGSLTPTPAEPRSTDIMTIKSAYHELGLNTSIFEINSDETEDLLSETSTGSQDASKASSQKDVIEEVDVEADGEAISENNTNKTKRITVTMPNENRNETQTEGFESLKSELDARMNNMEQNFSKFMENMTNMMENDPRVSRSGYVSVDGGTSDSSIKSVGDMLLAVKRRDHKRLQEHYGLKAQTTDSGSAGGYLIEEEKLDVLMPGLTLTSGVGNLINRINVNSPSGSLPIRDYSRVPQGNGESASAAGVDSQRRAEGASYTDEQAFFELLEYTVRDVASGTIPVSKEMSSDYGAIEALLREAIREDVANKEEYYILRGNGVGQPLGVLNWVGTVEVTEDTAGSLAVEDTDEMVSRLLYSNFNDVAWVHHPDAYTSIANLERGTGGAVYQTNMAQALPQSLHGFGRLRSQHLPRFDTTGYLILGDWKKYFMFERGGLYVDYSEHAGFTEGNNIWRFGKRIDGKPVMTSAVTLADGTFTQSPFVVISS